MPGTDPERFEPHAARAMASMFDDVSGRYDVLNRVMTLGQDGAWREAMWRAVPASAAVVLDLCTGSGVSLPGLRRPGRLVLGIDVSFAMLAAADERHGGPGWAPRFVCADAFRLPLPDGSIDAITVAFGVRNLRPRTGALAEIARVLRPGGTLVVLEAAAPAPGPLAPFHAFWVRHVIPLAGRLSPDPSAYRYLSQSIFEFGSGVEFERDLAGTGFDVAARRAFLLGATRLWAARRAAGVGQNRAEGAPAVQDAMHPAQGAGEPARSQAGLARESAGWRSAQGAVATALAAALVWALIAWINVNRDLPLSPVQRTLGWGLLIVGLAVFGVRALLWIARLAGGGRGR
ncbi:MAG TPA: ubiquinone/menaquinone biosynthesis methyltransferase [Candidatus Acidoferrales bacterium]|nr:ubiquinone/menaquinone biosynthesis methyltransferase [Candidatus Acidoferrales bacterium]